MNLPKSVLAELTAHAEQTYPDECCGLLVRRADASLEVHRLRNVQNEMHEKDPERYPRTARTAYSPDSMEFKAALDASDAPGCSLAAFYHSHPDHDVYFSDEDVAQATPLGEPSFPDALQIVVSVYDGRFRAIGAFGWSAENETYDPVALDAEGGAE